MAAAKVIADFAKGNDKLVVKAGNYAGKAMEPRVWQVAGFDPVEGSADRAAARRDAVSGRAQGRC